MNIVGPTGVGKTELAKDIVKTCFQNAKDNGAGRGFPAVYVEVPIFGGASFNWKGLYFRMLEQLNAPSQNIYRAVEFSRFASKGATFSARYRSEDDARRQLERRIHDAGVKVLILDEVQHLFKFSAKNTEKSLDILKNIANTTGCQVVLIGTYESLGGMNWSGQLMRRTVNIHFGRYQWGGKEERKRFAEIFSGLLAHVPFELDVDLLKANVVELMYQHCCGCVGVLKQNIDRALTQLDEDNVLESEGLLQASIGIKELKRMAQEIREGESFFEDEDDEDLGILLGMQSASAAKASTVDSKAKKSSKRPGTRKPVRDKVGS